MLSQLLGSPVHGSFSFENGLHSHKVHSAVSYWGVLAAEQAKSPEEKTQLSRRFAEEDAETCSKHT
jgi:hypothetical protein